MTTTSDDMVERVGRALAAAADDEFEPNRDFWGRYSRAAIESIQPYILPYILGADGPFVRDSDHCAAILAAEKRGEERERERIATDLFDRDAFMTACAGDGDPYVKVQFKTLKEMQRFHRELCKLAAIMSQS